MRTEGQRKSDNFEDRGTGRGMRAGGGVPIAALAGLVRILGWKGTLILGAIALVAYFFLPGAVKEQVFSGDEATGQVGSSSVCQASPGHRQRTVARVHTGTSAGLGEQLAHGAQPQRSRTQAQAAGPE